MQAIIKNNLSDNIVNQIKNLIESFNCVVSQKRSNDICNSLELDVIVEKIIDNKKLRSKVTEERLNSQIEINGYL